MERNEDNPVAVVCLPPVLQPVQVTAKQLQQLVAPIASYPDELVAEILTASTYPIQIVEADRWLMTRAAVALICWPTNGHIKWRNRYV